MLSLHNLIVEESDDEDEIIDKIKGKQEEVAHVSGWRFQQSPEDDGNPWYIDILNSLKYNVLYKRGFDGVMLKCFTTEEIQYIKSAEGFFKNGK